MTAPDPARAVDFDALPLGEQARFLRRVEPGKAVAFDLTRPEDGTSAARMFYGRDDVTLAAARQWAALAYEWLVRPAVER